MPGGLIAHIGAPSPVLMASASKIRFRIVLFMFFTSSRPASPHVSEVCRYRPVMRFCSSRCVRTLGVTMARVLHLVVVENGRFRSCPAAPIGRVLTERGVPVVPGTNYAHETRSLSEQAVGMRPSWPGARFHRLPREAGSPQADRTADARRGPAGRPALLLARHHMPEPAAPRSPVQRDFTAGLPNRSGLIEFTYVATWPRGPGWRSPRLSPRPILGGLAHRLLHVDHAAARYTGSGLWTCETSRHTNHARPEVPGGPPNGVRLGGPAPVARDAGPVAT
jgi:hypothetical protein